MKQHKTEVKRKDLTPKDLSMKWLAQFLADTPTRRATYEANSEEIIFNTCPYHSHNPGACHCRKELLKILLLLRI